MADDDPDRARDHGARVIQPPMMSGLQKGGPDSPMVCKGCEDWEACARQGYCTFARTRGYRYEGDSPQRDLMLAAMTMALPARIALCPDPSHAGEFYVPIETSTRGARCPSCPLPMAAYRREADVRVLLERAARTGVVPDPGEPLDPAALTPEEHDPSKRETLALGWLSAELAGRADAWNGNAPQWFPQPPEWLDLWQRALAATADAREEVKAMNGDEAFQRLARSAGAALERAEVGDAGEAEAILREVVTLDGRYLDPAAEIDRAMATGGPLATDVADFQERWTVGDVAKVILEAEPDQQRHVEAQLQAVDHELDQIFAKVRGALHEHLEAINVLTEDAPTPRAAPRYTVSLNLGYADETLATDLSRESALGIAHALDAVYGCSVYGDGGEML